MFIQNDHIVAQERYQEWVRAAELAAAYNRDESGASPVRPSLKEQVATWKSSLQQGLNFAWQRR